MKSIALALFFVSCIIYTYPCATSSTGDSDKEGHFWKNLSNDSKKKRFYNPSSCHLLNKLRQNCSSGFQIFQIPRC